MAVWNKAKMRESLLLELSVPQNTTREKVLVCVGGEGAERERERERETEKLRAETGFDPSLLDTPDAPAPPGGEEPESEDSDDE